MEKEEKGVEMSLYWTSSIGTHFLMGLARYIVEDWSMRDERPSTRD
jgi:hypothetical protein